PRPVRPTSLSPPPFPTRRSSDLAAASRAGEMAAAEDVPTRAPDDGVGNDRADDGHDDADHDLRRPIPHAASLARARQAGDPPQEDRKSTRLNSSHQIISYAVFCL